MRKRIEQDGPFYNAVINKKFISLDSLFIIFFVFVITYPILADKYLDIQPKITFTLYSNNANHFFVDSTQFNLNTDIELEIKNNSNEEYEVTISTYYQTFGSKCLRPDFGDTIDYNNCFYNQISHELIFPNNQAKMIILKKEIFLPNLYNYPINLKYSKIILDTTNFKGCLAEQNTNIPFGATWGFPGIDSYKNIQTDERNGFEFPIIWLSFLTIYYEGEEKYEFILYGRISHQPYILSDNRNTIATIGNYAETTGMYNYFQYYGITKYLNKDIYKCIYNELQNNNVSKCFKMEEMWISGGYETEKLLDKSSQRKNVFLCNLSKIQDILFTQKMYSKQILSFKENTNKVIIITDHYPYKFK